MVVFLLTWLYIGFTFEVCPFFWDIIDNGMFDNPYFFYYSFIVLFLLNYSVAYWRESFNNNEDILVKFFLFFFKILSIFLTLILAQLKKILHFLINFEYKKTFYVFINIFKNIKFENTTLWRPIFKKWSYFGYLKTNKSKWWKNK